MIWKYIIRDLNGAIQYLPYGVITSMIMRYKENTMRPAIGKASFPFRSLLAFIAFRISPMTAPAITP